jgi:hypothetical protein
MHDIEDATDQGEFYFHRKALLDSVFFFFNFFPIPRHFHILFPSFSFPFQMICFRFANFIIFFSYVLIF